MLQDSLSRFKYFFVLALMLVPMQAFAGAQQFFDPIDNTDTGSERLIYFYDQLGRSTFIQVTNTSDELVCIHVQVFEADAFCNEVDFDDCLTAGQTTVYDIANLPGNPDLTDSYGFVSISLDLIFDPGAPINPLIGMFRIIDEDGYEYRTNAASSEHFFLQEGPFQFANTLNFNNVNDPTFSDVVGITYASLDPRTVYASPGVATQFGGIGAFQQNLIFDHNEFFNSCSPVVFACDPANFNLGIDNSVPNTQGFDRICNTSKLEGDLLPVDSGWLFLPFIGNFCLDPLVACTGTGCNFEGQCDVPTFFVGFLGLNNEDGTGSMDSWISDPIRRLLLNGPAAEAQ